MTPISYGKRRMEVDTRDVEDTREEEDFKHTKEEEEDDAEYDLQNDK